MSMKVTEGRNERRTLSTPERTRPALFVPRATGALVGWLFLRIPPADRPRLLESMAVLDRRCPRRRNDFARVAPLVRSHLHHRGVADVWHVAPPDEGNAFR